MSDVFISHVAEDSTEALQLAGGLKQAGYSAWCYEHDCLPGISHLIQTSKAIDECSAFILVASPRSITSNQVGKEIERAHEREKPCMPILLSISYDELVSRQRLWGVVIGTQVAINLSPGGIPTILPKIVQGLRELGIEPSSLDESVSIIGATRLREQSSVVASEFTSIGQTRIMNGSRVFVLGFKPSTKGIFGRDEFGADCARLLESNESEFLCLHGQAGIGKSTVAALVFNQLSERDKGKFTKFIWYHLDDNTELETVLLRLVMITADNQALPTLGSDNEAFRVLLDLLRMRLVNNPVFVVFDNLESIFGVGEEAGTFTDDRWPELFRAFSGGNSVVLVTSRQVPRFFETSAQFRVVDGISRAEAFRLMREAGIKDEESVLNEAYRLMQGHPMALSALAQAVVRKSRYKGMISRAGDIMNAMREGPDQTRNPIVLFEKIIHPDRLPPIEFSLVTAMSVLLRSETSVAIGFLRPELSDDEVMDALDELNLRSLVRMDDADPPRYSLQPLVREVALSLVDDLNDLHRRIYNYYLSIQWNREARDPAQVEHLRLAVLHALAMNDLDLSNAVLYEEVGLAELLEQWGRFDLALPLHRKELNVARMVESEDDLMRAAGMVSECLMRVGNCEEALGLSEEAHKIAVRSGHEPSEGFYKGLIGQIYYRLGKLENSYEWLEKALNLSITHGDRKCEGICRGLMGMILSKRGEYDIALKWLNDALEIAVEIGDRASETEWMLAKGHTYFLRGDYEKAVAEFLPALELAIARGDKIRESKLRGLSGKVYGARGEFDLALEQYEQALEVDAQIGHRVHEGAVLAAIASIENHRGNHEKALNVLNKAVKNAIETGSKGGEAFRRGSIGEILIEMGNLEKAMEQFQYALSYAVQYGNKSNECPWRGKVGEVYFRRGDFARALECFTKAYEIAVEMGDRENQDEWAGKIGLVYLEQGEYDKAEGWLKKALDLSLQIGDIVNERNQKHYLGRLLMAQGKSCDAVHCYERAYEITVKLGSVEKIAEQYRSEMESAREICNRTETG